MHSPASDHYHARMAWFVYVLECRDGSLYTGIATDVQRRFAQHAAGKGGRYTRSHPPQRVLAQWPCADRSEATRAELAIKRLSPDAKRALCAGGDDSFRAVLAAIAARTKDRAASATPPIATPAARTRTPRPSRKRPSRSTTTTR